MENIKVAEIQFHDWCAVHALNGLLAMSHAIPKDGPHFAQLAYAMADAMIEEREKRRQRTEE